MKRLVLVALGMALLLALASALPAAAYGGESSATMSCTNNTSTMTRTVIVTITWHAVQDGGIAEADAQAYEPPSHVRARFGYCPNLPAAGQGDRVDDVLFQRHDAVRHCPMAALQLRPHCTRPGRPARCGQFPGLPVPVAYRSPRAFQADGQPADGLGAALRAAGGGL
jgi:hypothetical protein